MIRSYNPKIFEKDPENINYDIDKIKCLIDHFSISRKRIVSIIDRKKYFKDTQDNTVSILLNKLTEENFVIISHAIFRLVIDSHKDIYSIFENIMEYAFNYNKNSELCAKICKNLINYYPELPKHVNKCLHNINIQLSTINNDIKKRNRTKGCLTFICYLYKHNVIDKQLLLNQTQFLIDEINKYIKLKNNSILQDYAESLLSILKLKFFKNSILNTEQFNNLQKMLSIFSGKRNADFLGKVWYTFIEIKDSINN